MSIFSSCPITMPLGNHTATKCIGEVMVWNSSASVAILTTLAFLPLIILVAWVTMRDKKVPISKGERK